MNLKLKIVGLCIGIWGLSACSRLSDEQQLEWARGQEVYLANCLSCHGADGKGLGGTYPALTRESITSDFTARAKYLIEKGSPGNGGMLAIPISQKETIEVINYIQNAWGNEADFETLSPQLSKK
ncbi:c-type cytochrome [Reichenbachiella sp.]|uniref:c-type cytochrome n=1 Tax=Reichenbachiella sp. TaxID=2184521 RepID=UPI003BB1764A